MRLLAGVLLLALGLYSQSLPLGGIPVASPAGGTVTRTGSIGTWTPTTAATGSTSVTVPADATLAVVSLSTYRSVAHSFSQNANSMSLGASNMSIGFDGDGDINAFMGVVFYLVNPPTGSQTLAFNFVDTPAEEINIHYGFFKGVDTAGPIRASGGQQITAAGTATGGSLTAQTGDMAMVAAWNYNETTSNITWTNATEQLESVNVNSNLAWAEASPTGAITVNAALPADGGIGVLILKHN